jgi:signal transduction histidine kinase
MHTPPSLAAFSVHLGSRREKILNAWREASLHDPILTTGTALTRDQFRDHIPQVLDALERKLYSRPGGSRSAAAEQDIKEEEAKHGLQRWQQGFRLEELMREWGILHLCLEQELEEYAATNREWAPADQWAAGRELILLINEGVSESAARYASLERAEAAGRATDLAQAVTRLQTLERRRAGLIHQAVHDLRGNVQSVSSIAHLLGSSDVPKAERVEFTALLQDSVETLSSMLLELMELARLEAGQERRVVAPFDAAQIATDLCKFSAARAAERQLYLRHSGPEHLPVEGDAGKVRRLLQNLLVNALKYTEQGGVTVSWGLEKEHWWLKVQDTGPGLLSGPGASLAEGMREATATARESDERASTAAGRPSHVLDQSDAGSSTPMPARQQPGEGIGLSIVKRLCDLLDASIELISSGDTGTVVRILFPLSYAGIPENPAVENPPKNGGAKPV